MQADDSVVIINSSSSATIILPESSKNEDKSDDFYLDVRPLTISSPIGSHVVKTSSESAKINSYLTSVAIGPRKSGENGANYGPGNTSMTFYPDNNGGWLAV